MDMSVGNPGKAKRYELCIPEYELELSHAAQNRVDSGSMGAERMRTGWHQRVPVLGQCVLSMILQISKFSCASWRE